MAELGISETETDGVPTLRLSGRLDFDTAPGLHKMLQEHVRAGEMRIVVDLAGLDYIDTSGLATLIDVQAQLDEDGGGLVLCGLQAQVLEVFTMNQVNGMFQVAESETEVKELLGSGE